MFISYYDALVAFAHGLYVAIFVDGELQVIVNRTASSHCTGFLNKHFRHIVNNFARDGEIHFEISDGLH